MVTEAHELDPDAVYTFRVRLPIGSVVRAEDGRSLVEAAAELRLAAADVSRAATVVAELLEVMAGHGWRITPATAAAGRPVLSVQGLAGPAGHVLPESVVATREATAVEMAAEAADLPSGTDLTARVEGVDLPVVVSAGRIRLVYSLEEFAGTFPLR
ncbi:MAG: hypothetical protein M3024_04550 [Candidatus Dormibacteraeota bacterium]|nr:hypothetical protein [Candidatus Dormibacteraeota bacterium]